MRCPSCGSEVREGQKFCMECGTSLRGVADVTGEVPVVRPGAPDPEAAEATTPMPVTPPPPVAPPPPPPPYAPPLPPGSEDQPPATIWPDEQTVPVPVAVDDAARSPDAPAPVTATSGALAVSAPRTHELRIIDTTAEQVRPTAEVPIVVHTGEIVTDGPRHQQQGAAPAPRFRFRFLLLVALLAGGATAIAVLLTVLRITPPPDGTVPEYAVNDFGTNNTIGGVIAAAAMLVGALVWCTGHRWGAGLAGGAGAALAGWAALVVGAAEWRLQLATADADATRSIGYWALGAAAVIGLVAFVCSFVASGRDRRNGLDPWIAALAAVSFIIAAGGPLIPENGAGWASNWTGENPGGLPSMFFVGRAVQLGLVIVCGVLGCLLVRRWGLGLAIGGSLTAGWLLVTAATDRTASPIGPGYSNPLFQDNEPHAVTIVGFALAGFFCLVAVVMALLDSDR